MFKKCSKIRKKLKVIFVSIFLNIFLNILNAPKSGLSWKTKIYRPEDLKVGAFSICPELYNLIGNSGLLTQFQNFKPDDQIVLGMKL